MRTAINKKRIVLYAVCAFFFCLAGVFQAVICFYSATIVLRSPIRLKLLYRLLRLFV